MTGWIGVDLDGTLAHYEGWKGELHIGEPIPKMIDRVKRWISEKKEVRIITARVSVGENDRSKSAISDIKKAIDNWCLLHIGKVLPITCCKDFGMIELWDDRCIQIIPNTGLTVQEYFETIKSLNKI